VSNDRRRFLIDVVSEEGGEKDPVTAALNRQADLLH
jgi:hypothetical protein